MVIRRLLHLILLVSCLTGLAFLIFCCGVQTLYCAVGDPSDSWVSARDQVTTDHTFAISVPEYQVKDSKLYLKVQVTRPSPLIVTFVSLAHWDAEKVRVFRIDHPELESFWPDKERVDGGVQWLKR